MRIAVTVVSVLVGLLSIAAGGAKVALTPQEVEFLGSLGLGNATIIGFGIAQVVGGAMVLLPRTRRVGALIAALGFAASAGLILITGNLGFAGVSLIPALAAGWIGYASAPAGDTNP